MVNYGLGRVVQHDPRSRAFAYSPKGVTYKSVKHHFNIKNLDQGDLGSCTGNAFVQNLGYDSLFNALPTNHPELNESEAVRVYSRATELDPFPGTYKPDDTGSSGLAAAKSGQEFGYISGYQHAFSLDSALAALMSGPIMVGTNFYESMFVPDENGLVGIFGNVAGGHEYTGDEFDADKGLIGFRNSWGDWGVGGRFYMTIATFTQLLNESGDVTILTPLSSPAPVPVVPTADQTLIAAMDPWAKGIVSTYTQAGKAAKAYKTWKSSKGF